MWKSVEQASTTFVFKRKSFDETIKLVVSDFIHVWVLEITENELLVLLQDQNPLLEFNDEFSTHTVWSIIDDHIESRRQGEESVCSLHINAMEDNLLQFKFYSKMDCLAFKLNLSLTRKDSNILFEEVLSPVLSLANVLLARQDHLFSLLEKKDLEISQYKLEGATLSRRNVVTHSFNKNEFLNSYQECGSNFSEGICRVVNVLNLLSKPKPTITGDGDIPNKPAGSSREVKFARPNSIPKEAEVNEATQQKQDVKTTVLKVPKKKRTKLNI